MRRSCSLAAALSVLALAAPAAGAVRISAADSSAYPTVRATIVTTSPNEAAPTFRENGTPVAGLQTFNLAQAKSIVLAVDRSQSMAGASLASCQTDASGNQVSSYSTPLYVRQNRVDTRYARLNIIDSGLLFERLEESTIPLEVVATCLTDGRMRWFSEGPAAETLTPVRPRMRCCLFKFLELSSAELTRSMRS